MLLWTVVEETCTVVVIFKNLVLQNVVFKNGAIDLLVSSWIGSLSCLGYGWVQLLIKIKKHIIICRCLHFKLKGASDEQCLGPHLENGSASLFGRVIVYRCLTGFVLIGRKYVICNSNEFPAPTCFQKTAT